MTEVPGWIDARLDELVEVLDSRRVPVNSAERDVRIAGKRAVELFPYYGATGRVGSIDDFLFDEPLVLLGEDGVPFLDPLRNKAYLIEGRSWVNNHAHVLRAIAQIAERRYVLYCLNAHDYTGLVTGSTRLKLTQAAMREMRVPLPPLAEQKRIADKLDALLARVDACRDRLDRVPAILKRFREAVLSAAIRGKLGEASISDTGPNLAALAENAQPDEETLQEWLAELPSHWRVERADKVVEPGADIVYGIVQPGPKLDEGVPYVRGMDIVDGEIQIGQLLRTSPQIAQRYSRSSLRGGDVLLGIIRATKVAVVTDAIAGANITQGTARFRPGRSLRTRYLAMVLEAPESQRWLHAHYRGIDMPGLNLADVRRLPIPVPPVAEQDAIVSRVDAMLGLARSIEVRLATARAQVERLTPALLSKAFRGELVPQDPDDEPASALLARLKPAQDVASPVPNGAARRQARSAAAEPSAAPRASAVRKAGRPPARRA